MDSKSFMKNDIYFVDGTMNKGYLSNKNKETRTMTQNTERKHRLLDLREEVNADRKAELIAQQED